MNFKLFLSLGALLTALTSSPYTMEKELLPFRESAYTYSELIEVLEPKLHDDAKEFYTTCLQMMFNELPEQKEGSKRLFPNPRHSNIIIVGGWQCLLRKILESPEDTDAQKGALISLLALHKSVVREILPDLISEIEEQIPCGNCLASARYEYMENK